MEGYFESYSYGKSIITRFIYLQNILYKQCNVLTIMKVTQLIRFWVCSRSSMVRSLSPFRAIGGLHGR
jgi:hypothetical protein